MITTQKNSIDIVQTVEAAGVELKQQGNRYVGCCPLHNEMNPSFYVLPEKARFKCFGCGEGGDVIDFTQKYYGLSFKNALKHLGIETGPLTSSVRQNIKKHKRRAELIKRFQEWESSYLDHISKLYRKTRKLMLNGIPPEDLHWHAPLFHMLPVWEHYRDILINGTDLEKYELYKEAQKHGKFQPRR